MHRLTDDTLYLSHTRLYDDVDLMLSGLEPAGVMCQRSHCWRSILEQTQRWLGQERVGADDE